MGMCVCGCVWEGVGMWCVGGVGRWMSVCVCGCMCGCVWVCVGGYGYVFVWGGCVGGWMSVCVYVCVCVCGCGCVCVGVCVCVIRDAKAFARTVPGSTP